MLMRKNIFKFGKFICGSKENNNIMGTEKSDIILGKKGNDKLNGACGNDIIFGQKGDDTIFGANGNDFISGGIGKDTIYGGKGCDFLLGKKGDDKIKGEDGNDFLFGNLGDDNLYGGEGNDKLFGGHGKDRLFGDNGNDILNGGKGNDFLYGGNGCDKYVFDCKFGHDIVYDEKGCNDLIEFKNIKYSKLAFLKNGDDLIIGNKDNIVEVKKMFSECTNHQIEKIEAKCGYYLDIDAINSIVEKIASYSCERGIEFTHVSQVQGDKNLMNLIANSWSC